MTSVEPLDSTANKFFNPDLQLVNYLKVNDLAIALKNMCNNYPVALYKTMLEYLEEIENLEVYEDDTWVLTYPKCGTTWIQEAVWQICNGVTLNASGLDLNDKFPFLE